LQKIDANKLLLLDMGTPDNEKVNYLLQDFNQSLVGCMEQGLEHLKKYNRLVLVFDRKSTPHPEVIVDAVDTFCKRHSIPFKRKDKVTADGVEAGTVYFVVRDADLVEVIKTCRNNNFELGKDVGVLSYNDTPMKQIVGGGISVISTDFKEMGQEAANFIKNKQKIARVLPTSLILRESI